MEFVIEMVWILLPLVVVGIIAIFVVTQLKTKQKRGTLGKKNSQEAQTVLDSLIPLGMLLGAVVGIIFNFFFSDSLLLAISLGPGIGLLGGYFAYELYSKKKESDL